MKTCLAWPLSVSLKSSWTTLAPTVLVQATLTFFPSLKHTIFPPTSGLFQERCSLSGRFLSYCSLNSLEGFCLSPSFLREDVSEPYPGWGSYVSYFRSKAFFYNIYHHTSISVMNWTQSISPDNKGEACSVSLLVCLFFFPAPNIVPDTRHIQWLCTCMTWTVVKILKYFNIFW